MPRRELDARTRVLAAAGIIIVAHVAIAWTLRIWAITTGEDDAEYLLLGRAIAEGHYREVADAVTPWHAKYPPLYPAALALVRSVAGERIDAFAALGILLSGIALVCLFDLVRRGWDARMALLVTAVSAFNPFLLMNAGRLMSETLFMSLAFAALWSVVRDRAGERSGNALLAGASAILSALARSVGVTLVAALIAEWALSRKLRRLLWFTFAALVFIGGWLLWTVIAPNPQVGTSYVADAAALFNKPQSPAALLLERLVHHARAYLGKDLLWAMSVPTVAGTPIDNAIWLAVLMLLLAVGIVVVWQRTRIVALYLLAYVGLLAIWPWTTSRFLEPIVPLLTLSVLAGGAALGSRLPRGATLVPTVLAALLLLGALPRVATEIQIARACDRAQPTASPTCFTPTDRAFFAGARYAARSTPPTAVFVTPKAKTFFYYSNRKTVEVASVDGINSERVVASLRAHGATHIMFAPLGESSRRLRQITALACRNLDLMERFPPNGTVFRIRASPLPADSSAACLAIQSDTVKLLSSGDFGDKVMGGRGASSAAGYLVAQATMTCHTLATGCDAPFQQHLVLLVGSGARRGLAAGLNVAHQRAISGELCSAQAAAGVRCASFACLQTPTRFRASRDVDADVPALDASSGASAPLVEPIESSIER